MEEKVVKVGGKEVKIVETEKDVLVNLTPHPIVLLDGDRKATIPKSGLTVRLSEKRREVGEVEGFPINEVAYDEPKVPELDMSVFDFFSELAKKVTDKEVALIVSNPVAQALRHSTIFLLVPDTARAIRDKDGRILGVPGFITF